ncbi:hypothetical protein ERHA55_53390 (plasmid) [Erwinia rhapontici]|nr:hypothetical protein ERHA55_53390 [Erwinia rhapontici]
MNQGNFCRMEATPLLLVRFSSRQAISFSVREAIDTILKFEADSL